MGLDITAYKQLKPAPGAKNEVELVNGHQFELIECVHFSIELIEDTEKDFGGLTAGLSPGTCSWTAEHSFRAGGYGWYDDWRRDLATFAGTTYEEVLSGKQPTGTPFAELINFYDNQGVIGPVVSAKLAADFVGNVERANRWAVENDDDEWLEAYQNWMIAFTFAADNGAVDFH